MLYRELKRSILERFRSKQKAALSENGPNSPVKRQVMIDKVSTNVHIHFKKGNKEKIDIPCIIIRFAGEQMRDEEHKRGSEIENIVGHDTDLGGVDTLWSAPHPDPCDVTFEFLVYGRNDDDCEYIMSDIKRLFPQKWYLAVKFEDGKVDRLDMLRINGPNVEQESDLILDSTSILDTGSTIWSIKYLIEGYDENVHERRYETTVVYTHINYSFNGKAIESDYELDLES